MKVSKVTSLHVSLWVVTPKREGRNHEENQLRCTLSIKQLIIKQYFIIDCL